MTLLQTLAAEMAGLTQIVFHVGDPSGLAPARHALGIGRSLASDADVVATRPLIKRIEEIGFEWGGARPIADQSFLGAPAHHIRPPSDSRTDTRQRGTPVAVVEEQRTSSASERATKTKLRLSWSAIAGGGGGLLILAGPRLPWSVSAGAGWSSSGMDFGNGNLGSLISWLGIVVLVLALVDRWTDNGYRLLMALLGLLAVAAAWYEGAGVASGSPLETTVGFGLYAIGAGGVIVTVTSLIGSAERS